MKDTNETLRLRLRQLRRLQANAARVSDVRSMLEVNREMKQVMSKLGYEMFA